MGAPENRSTSGREQGRFKPGVSGNPGGRPKGIAAAVKALVGEDGKKALDILWAIAQDTAAKDSDRITAAECLLSRGFGKPAIPVTGAGGEGAIVIQVDRAE